MTDYHNEPGDGIVWGIPHTNVWKNNNLIETLRLRSSVNSTVSNPLHSKGRGMTVFWRDFVVKLSLLVPK